MSTRNMLQKTTGSMTYLAWVGIDDAHARRWSVVDSLALLAVGVPDAVHMLLLELVIWHAALGKLCPPERQGRVQGQPNALKQQ